MPEMIRVKPAVADTLVRNPDRKMRPLSPRGELVPNNQYWIRRLRGGCVVEVKEDASDDGAMPRMQAESSPPAKLSDPPSSGKPGSPDAADPPSD